MKTCSWNPLHGFTFSLLTALNKRNEREKHAVNKREKGSVVLSRIPSLGPALQKKKEKEV